MAQLPDEPAALAEALSRAQSEYPRMGKLLTEVESFVLREHAAAVVAVRQNPENAELTAEERKVIAKADPSYMQAVRLRDMLEVIVQALKNKCFAIMNTRNFLSGAGMSQ